MGAQMEIARVTGAILHVAKHRTRQEGCLSPDRCSKDGVVFLAALPTEDEREKHARAIAAYVLLSFDRGRAHGLGLERGVHRVAAAQELMHAEWERRETCRRILHAVASQEPGSNGSPARDL